MPRELLSILFIERIPHLEEIATSLGLLMFLRAWVGQQTRVVLEDVCDLGEGMIRGINWIGVYRLL